MKKIQSSLLLVAALLSQGAWAGDCATQAEKNSGMLLAEWDSALPYSLMSYKESYLLLSNSSNPNHAPSSPNPSNQAPFTYPLQKDEAKFQLSAKSNVFCFNPHNTVWLAYTQQSYWQVLDSAHSRPFRENNYEPEIIFSHRYAAGDSSLKVLNLGLVHQSNGQSLPRSRSWNRVYVQAGWESKDHTWIVEPRIWARVDKSGPNDDNLDITRYLGFGEVNVRYLSGPSKWSASALVRAHSVQLGLNMPIEDFKHFQFYMQYFTGYGESLIDYNQRHNRLGFGVSLMLD